VRSTILFLFLFVFFFFGRADHIHRFGVLLLGSFTVILTTTVVVATF
jgi:hypothetical protein